MIKNIWAIGRNYADHAKELGNEVPSEPLIFLKAGSCATFNESTLRLPEDKMDIHHEVELALLFGENLSVEKACIALDLTDREAQNKLKAKGQPWTLAKSFKNACPLSEFFAVNHLKELENLNIFLTVNGTIRQSGNTQQMIFSPGKIIEFILHHFPVEPGDLLLTGTPSGVGPLKKGDLLVAEIENKIHHTWSVI